VDARVDQLGTSSVQQEPSHAWAARTRARPVGRSGDKCVSREILVPASTLGTLLETETTQNVTDDLVGASPARRTYAVARGHGNGRGGQGDRGRTVASHGITGPEIKRLKGAARFMALHCLRGRSSLWWVSTNGGTSRSIIDDIRKRITRLQGLVNLPAYSVATFESGGGLHAHILFIGNREVAKRLQTSAAFGEFVRAAPVTNLDRLVKGYLVKERTPQASYRRHLLGGRLPGSHRLDGGGDRVRLSRELERDAIDAGYVQPWRHTNAKRTRERTP
jgi:hypothetical protein